MVAGAHDIKQSTFGKLWVKPAGPGIGFDVGVGQPRKEAATHACVITPMSPMSPTRPPWPRPLLPSHLSSQFPNPNRILNTHSPLLRPAVRKQEGVAELMEAFGNGAGLGNPHYLCPNWVSRFLFTLLSAVGLATAWGRTRNLPQSAQPSE